jgi:hypothetical protein
MQGIKGAAIVKLLQVLNNAPDGSLRLARRVKIDEKNSGRAYAISYSDKR